MNQKLELFKENMKGKSVAVIGIGVSNTPLIRFLVELGAKVTAFDKKSEQELGNVYIQLKELGVEFSLGDNYLDNLNHSIIFKTPGMRFDTPELLAAKENGSIITSEMEAFFDLCPAQIIAVTGSDGKTTTTTLIYEILKEKEYTCWLGGNIGKPLLSEIENIQPDHKVVLELSSFQLHTMQSSPDIAVITNITPNHLDMHKSMEEYVDAKKNIFLHQAHNGKLVLNYDNDITRSFEKEAKGRVIFFSRQSIPEQGVYVKDNSICFKTGENEIKIMDTADILLPGIHNVENYMAAIAAVWEMVDVESIKKVARTFNGVEHRIEFVREVAGIKFYNDSIASSPTRTIAGLNSFKQKVILIAGGYDKNIPFDKLGKVILDKVKVLVLIGKTAEKIAQAVKDAAGLSVELPTILRCTSLEEAVKAAYSKAVNGDIVILSPACASFDMFKNFEERGNKYKEIVKGL
ncbi:MAG: UDP-N-acetylmuramoyl-L-alanine--D-glutamate ligase [Clostridiaceae bacterium]|nr:UDP-N-acetylmuramoyl-L-alanine--D-glutamate ligase [Clostridiaceae bacterium]